MKIDWFLVSIVWFSSKVTTLNSIFLIVYSSENTLFLYLHFTWLYGSWNHPIILKTHPFWKYDSWFSSDVSKLASVRNKLIMSLKYWFMETKNVFRSCYGPKKWPKYHLKTIMTTFSERNEYYEAILVKINFCQDWKCMISGVFHRSGFWHLWRKPVIIFSKWMFFQNSLVISWAI